MIKIKWIFLIVLVLCSSAYATSYPLQVVAPNGTITIKQKPLRIVVLEFGLMDELNLLGVTPVGYGENYPGEGGVPIYLREMAKKGTSVGARDIPNLEAIAKLKPDLILGDFTYLSNINPQLSKIAPTVLLNGIFGDSKEQVKNLKTLAQITNTESKVPSILASYSKIKSKAINLAKQNSKKTVLMGYITPAGVFKALAANALATPMLSELNRENLITKSERNQLVDLSVEGILQYNPDQIVVLLTDSSMLPFQKLSADPLWADVRANKDHQVYFMDRDVWARSHGIQTQEVMYNSAISSGFLSGKPNH